MLFYVDVAVVGNIVGIALGTVLAHLIIKGLDGNKKN